MAVNNTGMAGVKLTLSGSQNRTTTTDAVGNFSFADVPSEGNYTVTPTLVGNAFSPLSKTYNALASNQYDAYLTAFDTHSIGGRVTVAGGAGIAGALVTISGTQSGTLTTNANGDYDFEGLFRSGDFTLTVSHPHYTFAQPSQIVSNLTSNRTVNFSGTLKAHTLAGHVTLAGLAMPGVTVTLSGTQARTTTSAADGSYSFANLPAGGNYTVTLSKTHYTFAPPVASFNDLGANQTTNFAATLNRHTLSGRIVNANNAGAAGILVTLSGAQSATATTSATGDYSFANLAAGGNYTVTPTHVNYSFNPTGRTFNNLGANQSADFLGTLNTHIISGRVTKAAGGVGLSGAVLTLTGTQAATTTTNATGDYSFAGVPAGGNYTVAVARTNYSFAQTSSAFSNLGASQTANFSGTLVSYTIGGSVTASGAGLGGVTITLAGSQAGQTTTDAGGNYAISVPAEGNYTVTPSKTHYTFAPPIATLNNLGANQTTNFDATLNTHALAGRVTLTGLPMPGVTVTLSGTQARPTTSAVTGSYSFAKPLAAATTPSHPRRRTNTFAPPVASFNDLGANQTTNFSATLNRHTLSGRIVNANNAGAAGILVTLAGTQSATAATDAAGGFAFSNLAAGGSYTVTPSLRNYTFTPAARTFDDLGGDQSVVFSGGLSFYTIGGRVTEKGAGLGGIAVTLTGTQTGQATTDAAGLYSFRVIAEGNYAVMPSDESYLYNRTSASFANLSGDQLADFAATPRPSVEFGAVSSAVSEGAGAFEVVVTRGGDTSGKLTVNYSATDGTARQGADLSTVIGQTTFAPGETTRTITVYITDDAYVEGRRTATLSLRDPTGGAAMLGNRSTATLTITDNDQSASGSNPSDDARFFVRQHYRDFLNREPDAAGLDFWAKQIVECGTDAACVEEKRQNVSAAFFLSIEFQQTGFLVYRLSKSAYGRMPRRVEEFLFDSRLIGEGVAVGLPGWAEKLDANKHAFVSEFVARPSFVAQYPLALTPAQFVAQLNANTGAALKAEEAAALAASAFGGATDSSDASARSAALLKVAENAEFARRELNKAFVLMQYFGYLQRNPDDPRHRTSEGFDFAQEARRQRRDTPRPMVSAFIDSIEYRKRFGQ